MISKSVLNENDLVMYNKLTYGNISDKELYKKSTDRLLRMYKKIWKFLNTSCTKSWGFCDPNDEELLIILINQRAEFFKSLLSKREHIK